MPTRSSSRVPSGTSNPRARRRLFLSSVDDGGGASVGSGAPLIAANSTTENQAVSHASDIVHGATLAATLAATEIIH